MARTIKLNELRTVIDSLPYPVSKADVIEDLGATTLRYADGEESLEAVLDRSNVDTFGSVEDLEAEVYSNLPTEAVGEPGQSEGEG